MRFATSLALGLVASSALAASIGSAQTSPATPATKPPTVLFMCPHGAAKSVLASAYFQRAAKKRGLNVRVESAGTEPDPAVSAAVAAHLTKNGYAIPIATPTKVTPAQLASADVVISIGCDLSGLPQPKGRVVRWDDVPGTSENFAAADEAIRKRVTQLIEELVRAFVLKSK
jgi:arsenate reductase (thioredoxin)